jgi:2-polyprenyl-3-methyl-5-hydroxy-6-metoxy-1,4-benzoquinol methylase
MDTENNLVKWHEDEKNWWDKNGDYMSYQWKLTPFLNKVVRKDVEKDYEDFVLMPGKKLLDVGCGSGWLSTYFSDKGMNVLGVDVSKEQIEAAEKLRTDENKDKLNFICCDLVNWDCNDLKNEFDVVFVNAFLHHLPLVELELILDKIAYVLKSGGKAYLYEPLEYSGRKKGVVKFIDSVNNKFIHVLLNIIPKAFGLHNERHKREIANGYTMASPHERPIDVEFMKKALSKSFNVAEIRAWHIYTIGFSMQTMGLKRNSLAVYSRFVKLIAFFEKKLIKIFDWHSFSKPGRFILCSIKLVKK